MHVMDFDITSRYCTNNIETAKSVLAITAMFKIVFDLMGFKLNVKVRILKGFRKNQD